MTPAPVGFETDPSAYRHWHLDALPKTATGKVQRFALRERRGDPA